MKKVIYIFVLIFLIVCAAITFNALTSGKISEVTLIAKKFTAPVTNERFYAQNLQVAYDKIKNGDFDSEDVTSSAWKNASILATGSEDSPVIKLYSNLSFGPGIKNSDSDTEEIIQNVSFEFVQKLAEVNGTPAKMISFHQPGNTGKPYTNEDGIGKTELSLGWTAIYKGEDFIKYVNIKSSEDTIDLDISNPSDLISTEIRNIPEESRAQNGIYTLEYGQAITYQLKVDKSFLKDGASIKIESPANLVIDEISVDSEFVSKDNVPLDTTTSQISDDPLSLKMNAALTILNNLAEETSFNYYKIEIEPTSEDFVAEITAHMEPIASVTKSVIVEQNGEERQISFSKKAYEPYPRVSSETLSGLTKNYSLSISATSTNDQSVYCKTAPVGSTGINFLLFDAQKKEAVTGGKFVLGKKVGETNYFWKGKNEWEPVGGNLKTSDFSGFRHIVGGATYVINAEETQPLPGNSSYWSHSSKDEELSNSVIQIMGLGQSSDYFLFQIESADGMSENFVSTNFQAFRETPEKNSDSKILTSLGESNAEDYTSNLLLPSYIAGKNEFNLLSVNTLPKDLGASRLGSTLIIILFIVLLILLAGFIMLKTK